MKGHTLLWMFVVGCVLSLFFASRGAADVPQGIAGQDTLQNVLDRIHEHAGGEAWKKEGWRDEAIEGWLEKLVAKVAKAAEFPELKLPVHLADVRSAEGAFNNSNRNVLFVGKSMDFGMGSLVNSIVLVDGSVDAGVVQGSIIVARGAVNVRMMSRYSLIISGTHVKITGSDGEPNNPTNGSLIVSRGRIDITRTHGTLLVAPLGVIGNNRIGALRDVVLINTPAPMAQPFTRGPAGLAPVKNVEIADLPLDRAPIHPLGEKISVEGVVYKERPGRLAAVGGPPEVGAAGVVFRYGGRRYVADRGAPIVDEVGKPVESLRDWKLTYIDTKAAIFSSDSEDVALELEAK